MIKTCVLIPSYNEAKTIGGIIKDLNRRGMAVYVVDDGSADETASIAQAERAIVIRHNKNMGKGVALRDGFERILIDGFDAVLVMDGDGQHHVDDIGIFMNRMNETNADMVVGNRMTDTGSMPQSRVLTNKFMSNLISKISGQHIPDTQCGFRLVKREILRDIKLDSRNYEIESEMILRAAKKGFKIDSVSIRAIYEGEMSRINPFIDTIRFLMLLIKLSLT